MLLLTVERFLRRSGIAPTRFGRDAVHDPRFVLDLRAGRTAGDAVARRVLAYIAERSA